MRPQVNYEATESTDCIANFADDYSRFSQSALTRCVSKASNYCYCPFENPYT